MSNLVVGDYVLDNGLAALHTYCDKIFICSAEPTSYTDATSTHALGSYNFGAGSAFGSPGAGSPSGRVGTSAAITSGSPGSVTASGTAVRWAAVDTANSRLLAEGIFTGGGSATSGQSFTLGVVPVHLFGTAAVVGGGAATFDPARSYNGSLDSTNLTFTALKTLGTYCAAVALGHISGTDKRYFEVAVTTDGGLMQIGLANLSYVITNALESDANAIAYDDLGRVARNGSVIVSGMSTYGNGDRVQIAVDAGNARAWFRLNGGNWNNNGSADPASNVSGVDISAITGSLYPIVVCENSSDAVVGKFDSSSWSGTAPSGFTQVPIDTYSAATFDPANSDSHITLSNGNLTATVSSGAGSGVNVAVNRSRNGLKLYAEFTITTMAGIACVGVTDCSGTSATLGGNSTTVSGVNIVFINGVVYVQDGTVYRSGSSVSTISTFASGDTIAMAIDTVNEAVWFRKYSGGSWGNWNNNGSADPASNAGGISAGSLFGLSVMSILAVVNLYTNGDSWTANFGGSSYIGTPPTGFVNW